MAPYADFQRLPARPLSEFEVESRRFPEYYYQSSEFHAYRVKGRNPSGNQSRCQPYSLYLNSTLRGDAFRAIVVSEFNFDGQLPPHVRLNIPGFPLFHIWLQH